MRIESIDLYHVALPLRDASGGRLETVLAALHSGGATGWGEAPTGAGPIRGAEWAAGALGLLHDWFAPAVVGQDVASAEDMAKLLARFRGNPSAKAALDMAWWDLSARLQNRPLFELLGAARDAVEVGPTFDQMDSIDAFLERIGAAVAAGFDRIKVKFRPGWDIRVVDLVRKECPTQSLHVDCEGGLHLGHMDMLYRLEDFMLSMIEQPLAADDLVGHAMVQESLRTPVGLDESVASTAQAEMALELQSCKYVNLKPDRVGGLTAAVAIHDLCHERCVPCFVGAVPQSAVGGRIAFALAAKDNCTYPSDYFAGDQILAEDLAEPLLPARDPADGRQRVRLDAAPGIGIEPVPALLEKFCIAQATVLPA